MRNFTEPQDLLKEIVKQTSGELSAVEVITYVEALSRSTSILVSTEKDASMEPSSINFTLTVILLICFYLTLALSNCCVVTA